MLYISFILSYLIGSISFAIIVSSFFKLKDPRSYGSKNAGATNVMRSGNKKAAILTLLGDLLKGVIVVALAKYIYKDSGNVNAVAALCAVLVVLGHIYPVFFKFKGGKGVATAIGTILVLNPKIGLCLIVVWLLVFSFTKISSLAAIVATASAPVFCYIFLHNQHNASYSGAISLIAFFVLYKHKSNILRLITAKEQSFKGRK